VPEPVRKAGPRVTVADGPELPIAEPGEG